MIESLRGHTTGLAIPTFVVDAPGGAGKIPLMPNYLISGAPGRVVLRNFEGVILGYSDQDATNASDVAHDSHSVADLNLHGGQPLVPNGQPHRRRNGFVQIESKSGTVA
jgi:lysine 2,3-aminomutase